MSLEGLLSYIGLLITAYSITQEYNRIKLKLSSITYNIIFFITLIVLFLSSNEYLRNFLIYKINIREYFTCIVWQSKYHILIFLNIFSLYKIFISAKLNKNNSKIFFELVKNLEVEKKYDLKSKLIKDNLDKIFKYRNYDNILLKIQNRVYNFISPNSSYYSRIKKGINQVSKLQKSYLDSGGDFNKLNEIGKLPITDYTKIENIRKYISEWIKPKLFQNYFTEVYNFILDKKFIKYIIKNDEQLGLEILKYIAQYQYFAESYRYTEYFLKKTLSNKNSLAFKYLLDYANDSNSNLKFMIENQCENSFDLGLIICETIENIIIKNEEKLQIISFNYEDNKIYKHISNLYKILRGLEVDKMHLAGTPYYIQNELIKLIDFSKQQENQNLAFQILLEQLHIMKDLILKTNNNDFIKQNFNNLFEEVFKNKNINEDLALEIALCYSDYIFDKFSKATNIEDRIKKFKKFIDKTDNQFIISIYLKVFDKDRRYNGKDYISYIKSNQNLQKHWDKINNYLQNKI